MKSCRISNYVSMAALAALLPLGMASARAASAPSSLQADDATLQQASPRPMDWTDLHRRKLRRAYWLLEQGDHDYRGHRLKAMEEIQKAGKITGIELKGEGYGGEKQKWSDERMREAKGLLEECLEVTVGRERAHIKSAIQQINLSLEIK